MKSDSSKLPEESDAHFQTSHEAETVAENFKPAWKEGQSVNKKSLESKHRTAKQDGKNKVGVRGMVSSVCSYSKLIEKAHV